MRRPDALVLMLLVILAVAACSALDQPTDVPSYLVDGRLVPWGDNSPVDDRHIVLCRIVDQASDGECELMESASITDEQGNFAVSAVQPGTYFILYNSGLSDFDEAMDLWRGKTLRFGDMEWLSEFLGIDLRTEPVEYRVPEGISHSPHEGWLTRYCTLTLSVGNSPFIIAHDIEHAQNERDLRYLTVDITPGAPVTIEVQAAFYGDR